LIRKKYDQLDDIIYEAERNKKQLSAKQITDKIRSNKNNNSFFALAKEHVEDLEKSKKFNRAISDRSKAKIIKEFTKGKDVLFPEIDESFLRRFKVYLKNEKNNSERSVMNSYVFIRLLFNRAIKRGIIDQTFYPFGRGKILIKYPESLKIGLTEEEILKIEQLDLQKHTPLWHTRNIFLFSFYLAGIRITDLLHLKWNDIVDDRLFYRMKKNAKLDSLRLPEKVIEILEFYRPDQRSYADFIFPELKKVGGDETKQKYSVIKSAIKKHNSNLKDIADLAEIDKKITNHIARHSFGNIAGDKVSPQMLQKLYRHSSLSTTIGYQGNFIHASSDQALDEVLKFSNGNKIN
ncbi:MAG: site-specific integrase, partial [Salegentibacter mishustinae]|nr:site-specific integrase [Salegentibacter mishustinae]